jgi:flavin-binding protein dodecin
VLFVSFVVIACAGKAPVQEPAPMTVTEPVDWNGDPDLAPVLVRPQLGTVEMAAANRVEMRIGALEFRERLGVVVEDTTAHWLVRLNALHLLANRGATGELPVFVTALQARDERVRIGAVSNLREFVSVRPRAATEILVYALRDSSIRVQTAALQMLGDRDVDALREFLKRTQNRDVRAIALDLVRAAEERGAPLVAKDSLGTLERVTANGATLTFRPTQRWTRWDAAVGEVSVTLPGKKPIVIAAGVEQVGNVVPAFFSSDGKTLVYEVNREIRARDLASGADRKLADGIAPRMLPFTDDVIYFVEVRAKRGETANSFSLKYDVMRVPLAGGTPASIGQVNARALNELKGNYSNVRWSRVQEQEGDFVLVGEMMDPFPLPSPFGE